MPNNHRAVPIRDEAFARWILRGDKDSAGERWCRPCRRDVIAGQRSDQAQTNPRGVLGYRGLRMTEATTVVATSGNPGERLPAACMPVCSRHAPNGGI